MSISSMWNQYFNHYQPRQTEITKIKLATLNDVRKNWNRDISLCIKLLKCKLIQINLKRSLNLRDYFFSYFSLKKTDITIFFLLLLFYPWDTPQVPTVDRLKKDCFSPCKKLYHRCLSICLLLLFHTRGLSVGHALWMSKRWRGSLYAFIEGSFSHRRSACAV